ncbi:MAG: endonuclease/exonuclease/phosphatase family protein [Minwuia sp.]|nr:endonuclease/exonuclease/phosphatase family protein [Minwuia sp.]
MRIVSLNIRHGGGARTPALADYLIGADADVLAVTEFRLGKTGSLLTERLADAGYAYQHWTVGQPRKNAVLLATRHPMEPLTISPPAEHAHRFAGIRLGQMEIWAVYMALGKDKLPVYRFLHDNTPNAAVLVGDFNTGLHHLDETGKIFTAVDAFTRLQTLGWVDAWRQRHGDAAREFSRFSHAGNGFRLDHAFVTGTLAGKVSACSCDHGTRPLLTDHSAITIDLD